MGKRSVLVLLLVVLLVGGVALARPLVSGEQNGDLAASSSSSANPVPARDTLDSLLTGVLNGKKPAVLVFTYDADCCPSTREFFDQHKQAVQTLERKYKNYINFVWIDIAFYQETEREALMKLAQKYAIASIPAVVLIGKDGKAVPPIVGELDPAELDKQLQGLVSDS
ncbi:thiol-disulfide isomerase/thioredoxin [Desulfohalotomaculum tongense]|uniref:thioredoxin family protein n=1 Tax=Desulforadius tongensis TaxID=1216062 RepID=UPI00195E3401|nr:thioredoxin family protein [Desulforadius tongensis]MBM7855858.1 thiol-disulfide isomerase/thioredoxin [Desulforadius tongensis]